MRIGLENILTVTKKSWKEQESEKARGKKRYQERLIEEEEAEKLIRDYTEEERETFPEQDED